MNECEIRKQLDGWSRRELEWNEHRKETEMNIWTSLTQRPFHLSALQLFSHRVCFFPVFLWHVSHTVDDSDPNRVCGSWVVRRPTSISVCNYTCIQYTQQQTTNKQTEKNFAEPPGISRHLMSDQHNATGSACLSNETPMHRVIILMAYNVCAHTTLHESTIH